MQIRKGIRMDMTRGAREALRRTVVMAVASVATLAVLGLVGTGTAEAAAVGSTTTESGAKVTLYEDGTLVQRTPDDLGKAIYTNPTDAPSYNVRYLHADSRGCGACHEDLGELLANIEYDHLDLRGENGEQLSVQSCIDCHETVPYMTHLYNFGELIHGIHYDIDMNCSTCHVVTDSYDGNERNDYQQVDGQFLLWDNAKYDTLWGITALDTVVGNFTYDQELRTSKLFTANWMGWESDYTRYGNEDGGVPRDEQMLRDWEITVVDLDGTRTTFRMGDLIDQIESVTDVRTMTCGINCMNGGLMGNVEITGIPLKTVLEMAGVNTDDVESLLILDSAQAAAQWDGYPFTYTELPDSPDLLVYKINGELLSWENGFPVINWGPGTSAASADVKEVCEIYCLPDPPGWGSGDAVPRIAVFHLKDGQIVEQGQPLHIEGVADSFNERITAIQFSLDNGQTWTEYETSGTHAGNWTHFDLEWTPEQTGAFVLCVRPIDETGTTSDSVARYLINVKTADEIAELTAAIE